MSILNNFKPIEKCDPDWLFFSSRIGKLSEHLRKRNSENLTFELLNLMKFVLAISKSHNIDMGRSWTRWVIKASSKLYF
jgi:hypothetical protein